MSNNLSQAEECRLPKQEILQLKDKIWRVYETSLVHEHSFGVFCEYDNIGSETCEAKLKKIQCGIAHICQGYLEIFGSKRIADSRLVTLVAELQVESDEKVNEKIMELTVDYRAKIALLKQENSNLAVKYSEYTKKYDSLLKSI